MTNNADIIIGRVGTIDVIKFGGEGKGHDGTAYDPNAMFINMNFEGGDDKFYIVRWETDLDRKSVAPIMGSLALHEASTRSYLLGSEKWKATVPADLVEAEAKNNHDLNGIRVEQKEQTLLWRLPIMDDPSAIVAAFLTENSDFERIAKLAEDTARPEQLNYVLMHLPLFHQAYAEYANLIYA